MSENYSGYELAESLRSLGLEIKGITVKKVLLEAAAEIAKEFYVGITIDRAAKKIVYIVSQAGGIDIEEVAKTTPEKITKVYIDPLKGWQEAQGQELAAALFTDVLKQKAAQPILENLFNKSSSGSGHVKYSSIFSTVFKNGAIT